MSPSSKSAASILRRGGAFSSRCGSISRRRSAPASLGPSAARLPDIGDIAVIRDEGDVIVPPNAFDLKGTGLRFTRNSSGMTDGRPMPRSGPRSATASRSPTTTPSARTSVFVSLLSGSERTGVRQFGRQHHVSEEDDASTDRSVGRLLAGRRGSRPFLADLDPSTGGGVFVNAAADAYTVTWCGVRGFDSTQTARSQGTLLPDGTIDMRFAPGSPCDAVVGLSPGQTLDFRTVDLSARDRLGGGAPSVSASRTTRIWTSSPPQTFYPLAIPTLSISS